MLLYFACVSVVLGCGVHYRGCVSRGYNDEKCANWFEVERWGDVEFVDKDKALVNGNCIWVKNRLY